MLVPGAVRGQGVEERRDEGPVEAAQLRHDGDAVGGAQSGHPEAGRGRRQ